MITTEMFHFSGGFTYITSRSGSQLIVINDYTYARAVQPKNRTTTRWYCSTHISKRCKAKLVTNQDNKIISADYEHIHPPSKFFSCKGKYIRL